MAIGFRDEVGGYSFPWESVHIPRVVVDAVDSSGVLYEKDVRGRIIIPRHVDDDDSSVVTTANGLTGDVLWVGGSKIRVTTIPASNKIKISFDSDASSDSESGQESSTECSDPSGGGGVNPGNDVDPAGGGSGSGGGGSSPGGGGGVPAGGDDHGGAATCCD